MPAHLYLDDPCPDGDAPRSHQPNVDQGAKHAQKQTYSCTETAELCDNTRKNGTGNQRGDDQRRAVFPFLRWNHRAQHPCGKRAAKAHSVCYANTMRGTPHKNR